MGRLDLRESYRDEDFEYGSDARNPGTRQVRTTPALDREAAQPLIPAKRASASLER